MSTHDQRARSNVTPDAAAEATPRGAGVENSTQPGAASGGGPGDHRALALRALLGTPGGGQESAGVAMVRAFAPHERQALFDEAEFWSEPFWNVGGHEPGLWRRVVDPLQDVADAESATRDWARQSPLRLCTCGTSHFARLLTRAQ